VNYSRGRVWAPWIGISVGLMKVVTVGLREGSGRNMPALPAGRKRALHDPGYRELVMRMLEDRRNGG
jgi:hypothetical protein